MRVTKGPPPKQQSESNEPEVFLCGEGGVPANKEYRKWGGWGLLYLHGPLKWAFASTAPVPAFVQYTRHWGAFNKKINKK
jgi:hypothetical protein